MGLKLAEFLQHMLKILGAGRLQSPGLDVAQQLAGDDRVVFYDKYAIHRHLSERNGREAWAEQNGPISIKTELGEKILQTAQRAKGQRLL